MAEQVEDRRLAMREECDVRCDVALREALVELFAPASNHSI